MNARQPFRIAVALATIVASCSVISYIRRPAAPPIAAPPIAAPPIAAPPIAAAVAPVTPAWLPRPTSARAQLCTRGGRCIEVGTEPMKRRRN
jgi:hypothetical protein